MVTEGHLTRSPSEPCPPRIPLLRLRRRLQVQLQRLPPCVVQSVMQRDEESDDESSQEEEMTVVKEGEQQHNPRIDPHYVLHSQNAVENMSTNILTALTNRLSQKGHLKTGTHRIRVDFKVRVSLIQIILLA